MFRCPCFTPIAFIILPTFNSIQDKLIQSPKNFQCKAKQGNPKFPKIKNF